VHNLLDEKAKLVKKIKIGSCDEADDKVATSFAMAINEVSNVVAVQHGKRIKISTLVKGDTNPPVKCKIKGSHPTPTDSNTNHAATSANTLVFSPDGTHLILTHSNGLLFISTKDGKEKGAAPLLPPSNNYSPCYLQTHHYTTRSKHTSNKKVVLAVTQTDKGKASLFHVNTNSIVNNTNHFATLTNDDTTNDKGKKILHRVFLPRGKRGRTNLLLLELTPKGLQGDVTVSLTQVPYRTTTLTATSNNYDDGLG